MVKQVAARLVLMVGLGVTSSGCDLPDLSIPLEIKEELILMPDGSGKMRTTMVWLSPRPQEDTKEEIQPFAAEVGLRGHYYLLPTSVKGAVVSERRGEAVQDGCLRLVQTVYFEDVNQFQLRGVTFRFEKLADGFALAVENSSLSSISLDRDAVEILFREADLLVANWRRIAETPVQHPDAEGSAREAKAFARRVLRGPRFLWSWTLPGEITEATPCTSSAGRMARLLLRPGPFGRLNHPGAMAKMKQVAGEMESAGGVLRIACGPSLLSEEALAAFRRELAAAKKRAKQTAAAKAALAELEKHGVSLRLDTDGQDRLVVRLTGACDDDLARLPALLTGIESECVRVQVESPRITDAGLENLKRSRKLKRLDLTGTGVTGRGLEHLRSLTSLQELGLRSCRVLQNVDGLKGLNSLEQLDLSGCRVLQNVGGLRGLTGLKQLDLSSCYALQNVNELEGLTGLQQLDLSNCYALQNVDGLKGFTGLQQLDLNGCYGLQNVDGLKGLTGLQQLDLNGCQALQKVDGIKGLTSLQKLDLSACHALESVDGLKGLPRLRWLSLRWCLALKDVDGLKGLAGLEQLDLTGCSALENVDGLKGLTQLQTLDLQGCTGLSEMQVWSLLRALPNTTVENPEAFFREGVEKPLPGLLELLDSNGQP